jgi:addiction module RelE/StbE family toxin
MKIRWSPTAVSDLKSIRDYIARDRPAAAQRVAAAIKEGAIRLADFPFSGRAGRVPGTHELVIPGTSYIAAYRVQDDVVEIAAVLHGRQPWPESF